MAAAVRNSQGICHTPLLYAASLMILLKKAVKRTGILITASDWF
jgi:hypothetical protein